MKNKVISMIIAITFLSGQFSFAAPGSHRRGAGGSALRPAARVERGPAVSTLPVKEDGKIEPDEAVARIISCCKLANTCIKSRKNKKKAESALKRALSILKEFPSVESVRNEAAYIISGYTNLAILYIKSQDCQKAEAALGRALSILKEFPSVESVRNQAEFIISGYNYLATSYIKSQEYQEAEAALGSASLTLRLKEVRIVKSAQNQAEFIISCYNYLAISYIKSQDCQKAESALKRALSILKEFPSVESVRNEAAYIISEYTNLAILYIKSQDCQKAEACLEKAVAILEDYFGSEAIGRQIKYVVNLFLNLIDATINNIELTKRAANILLGFLKFLAFDKKTYRWETQRVVRNLICALSKKGGVYKELIDGIYRQFISGSEPDNPPSSPDEETVRPSPTPKDLADRQRDTIALRQI